VARKQTWIALLRGVNLGSHNKIGMGDLRELFADIGAEDVQTYVQSGNVVFRSAKTRAALTKAIGSAIRKRFGLDVTVVMRTKAELARLVKGNPFTKQSDPTKVHVTFLAEAPKRGRAGELEKQKFEPDEFRVAREAVYLHCPKGYGRSKLSNAFFEKQLGVRGTTRNWRTVATLADMANS
jgi:uncharacterized protein (DUF1697 family)